MWHFTSFDLEVIILPKRTCIQWISILHKRKKLLVTFCDIQWHSVTFYWNPLITFNAKRIFIERTFYAKAKPETQKKISPLRGNILCPASLTSFAKSWPVLRWSPTSFVSYKRNFFVDRSTCSTKIKFTRLKKGETVGQYSHCKKKKFDKIYHLLHSFNCEN